MWNHAISHPAGFVSMALAVEPISDFSESVLGYSICVSTFLKRMTIQRIRVGCNCYRLIPAFFPPPPYFCSVLLLIKKFHHFTLGNRFLILCAEEKIIFFAHKGRRQAGTLYRSVPRSPLRQWDMLQDSQ